MYSDRIRLSSLQNKVMSAHEAAALIRDGMTVGMSGFTRAGEAKAVPLALIDRAKDEKLQISLVTGASLGNDLDGKMAS
ncbi:MAG TPA: propionyl-CoA--succinate CoA transferase, partial [Pseudomonas sp.]|nr:propionyl-CoA--succinate CoA transferase [Pseudomonas sp.]